MAFGMSILRTSIIIPVNRGEATVVEKDLFTCLHEKEKYKEYPSLCTLPSRGSWDAVDKAAGSSLVVMGCRHRLGSFRRTWGLNHADSLFSGTLFFFLEQLFVLVHLDVPARAHLVLTFHPLLSSCCLILCVVDDLRAGYRGKCDADWLTQFLMAEGELPK